MLPSVTILALSFMCVGVQSHRFSPSDITYLSYWCWLTMYYIQIRLLKILFITFFFHFLIVFSKGPVLLYGSETRSPHPKGWTCIEGVGMGTVFEQQRWWRKLHNEELHNLFSSLDMLRIITMGRIIKLENSAWVGKIRNAYTILVGKISRKGTIL
jgi:hypothetical protein